MIASASSDGTIIIWDAHSMDIMATLKSYLTEILFCCFSPDCTIIASVNSDNTVRLIDISDGTILAIFKSIGDIRCCDFSPVDNLLVCGDQGGNISLLEPIGINFVDRESLDRPILLEPTSLESVSRESCDTPIPEAIDKTGMQLTDFDIPGNGYGSFSDNKEPTLIGVIQKRRSFKMSIYFILASLFCGGLGYALSLLSPWLWLVAAPLFCLAGLCLYTGLTLKVCNCPFCGKLLPIVTLRKLKIKTCERCNNAVFV